MLRICERAVVRPSMQNPRRCRKVGRCRKVYTHFAFDGLETVCDLSSRRGQHPRVAIELDLFKNGEQVSDRRPQLHDSFSMRPGFARLPFVEERAIAVDHVIDHVVNYFSHSRAPSGSVGSARLAYARSATRLRDS